MMMMMMWNDDGGGGDDDILKKEDRLVIKQKLSNRATGSLQKSLFFVWSADFVADSNTGNLV